MGLAQAIKAHYVDKNRPIFSRQIVLSAVDPGVGVTLTADDAAECTYGDWEAIAAYTLVTVPTIITGIVLDTPHQVGDCLIYTVDIGLTYIVLTNHNYQTVALTKAAVDDAAVPLVTNARVHRAEVRVEVVTDAGPIEPIMLPFPIWVPADVGILGRVKSDSTGGALDTINCSVLCVQHFELPFE